VSGGDVSIILCLVELAVARQDGDSSTLHYRGLVL
jgi:hypothetical protein